MVKNISAENAEPIGAVRKNNFVVNSFINNSIQLDLWTGH